MVGTIPSFLNRIDFISILLPGYVPIISYLLIFQPNILSFSSQEITFDIATTIVFIVAGPALGLVLQQLHRGACLLYSLIKRRDKKKRAEYYAYLENYASMRLKIKDNEQVELKEVEAYYDFCVSTGLALFVLSIFTFYELGFGRFEPYFLIVAAVLLLITGYLQLKSALSPTSKHLIKKYVPKQEFVY